MKYENPHINVPYLGMDDAGEPTRNFAVFRFKGIVDHRRIKRMVRKLMGTMLERTIHTGELRLVVKPQRITHAKSIVEGSASVAPIPIDEAE